MGRFLLRSKIHRATVTKSDRDYEGSLTIDEKLMEAANIVSFEQVHVLSVTTGNRLITYAIPGRRGSGMICTNGAAAELIKEGEIILILAYCHVPENEVENVNPVIVLVDAQNRIKKLIYGRESQAGPSEG